VHDITLVFFVTLALYLFWLGLENERRRTPLLLLFWAACGFAVLAKGPVGLLPPFVVVSFLLVTRRLWLVRELRMLPGIGVALAIAAPWYVLIALANDDYVTYFLDEKVFGSLLDSGHGKAEPFWYYLPVLVGGLLPWSLFLPAALWYAPRLTRSQASGRMQPAVSLLLVWLIAPFVVFSFASAKLATYIVPLFPAAALLVGRVAAELWRGTTVSLQRAFLAPMLLLCGLLLCALAVALVAPVERFSLRVGLDAMQVWSSLALLLLGFGSACLWVARRSYAGFTAAMLSTMAAALVVFVLWLAPSIEPYRSSRSLAGKLDRLLAPGEPIPFYRRVVGVGDSALFYTGRRGLIVAPPDLKDFLASDDPAYCVISQKHFARLGEQGEQLQVIHREGNRLILSNRSADDPTVRAALRADSAVSAGSKR
jgi:4-amino-4-deoxy-L-arabinose transferase-like glycosyltransferase